MKTLLLLLAASVTIAGSMTSCTLYVGPDGSRTWSFDAANALRAVTIIEDKEAAVIPEK